MHCLRKTVLYALLVSFFFPFLAKPVSADYTSITMSPATGSIYSDTTALSVYVNSGGDEFVGIDINLGFTGSVQYLSASGAARCTSFQVTPGSGTINIECFSTQHTAGQAYSGVVATLYFRSTAATGSSTFTFTSVDPNVTSKGTGSYTLTSATNPNAGQGGGDLPDSGLFDNSRNIIAVGGLLIFLGFFWSKLFNVGALFLGKIKTVREENKEKSIQKRRSKFEKDF
ncbi:MAG: hypothetical protein AB9915_02110 [Candidatus Dojkabacteria bacterium]